MKQIKFSTSYQQKTSRCKKLMAGDNYGGSVLLKAEKGHCTWNSPIGTKTHQQSNKPGEYSTAMRNKD